LLEPLCALNAARKTNNFESQLQPEINAAAAAAVSGMCRYHADIGQSLIYCT